MEVRILGPLEVLDEDRPVPLGGRRQRALLAILATRPNEVISSDRLVEEMWGETAPEGATNALQAAVSRLRRALTPSQPEGDEIVALVTRAPGYLLEADPETIDAARFERLARAGKQALAAGDPATAAGLLAEALELWRGPALADFVYEPFAQEEIARLEELRLATTEERLEADLACGRQAELVGELHSLAARHPLRERLRALLMVALYRSGRQTEALEVYRQYRETAAEEFGIDPGPELKELELKVLRQDRALLPLPGPQPPAAVEPSKQAAPEPRPVAPAVRKTVTIVFADLAESTVLAERLDPEALETLMTRYFEIAKEALHRHGGTVEKFIGDAVMAVFGIPVVHEDDALRALRAATDLEAGLAELNAELETEWGLRLAIRVGVNTGEVVTGAAAPGQGIVTGDPVNTAVRLQQAAAPGEILIGETTHALVAAAVDAERVPPLELKGKEHAVAVWRVSRIIPDAQPFLRRLDTRFVGRQAELAQLHQAFHRALAERSAYLFTVLGAPGVGKTRLALEFTASVRGEATVLTGRCLPYGEGITDWPLREILQSAFGDDVGRAVEERLDGSSDGMDVAERLSAAVGQTERAFPTEEIRWAARTLLEALAKTRPLVIVLEDLHWAEPTFLDLVDHVVDLASNASILLLCLARPELLEDRPAWGGGKRSATSLELEPLDDYEASELVGDLLRSADRSQADRIVAAAEGNPLFLEQMVAMLDETVPGDGEVTLPPSIQALLAARLERLGPGERAVLERAAIVGKDFSETEAAVLLPEEARPTLTRHVEALVRRRFVRPAPWAQGRGGPYRFRHVLIQEAAYRGISKRVRAELHERFAEWLEKESPDRGGEVEEILGHHFEQAYRLRTELGPADDQVQRLAVRASVQLAAAGGRALDRGDAHASVRLLERATGVLPRTHPGRLEPLQHLGEALCKAGDFRRGTAVLDETIELSRVSGQARVLSYALIERAHVRVAVDPEGADKDSREQAEAAIRQFEELGDERGLARAWHLWSVLDQHLCRWGPYREANERALIHARRAGAEPEVMDALSAIAHGLAHDATPVPEAIARCEEIRRESAAIREKEGRALIEVGFLFGLQGRRKGARQHFARSREIFEDIGLAPPLASVAIASGQAELLGGDPAAAELELGRGQRILEQIGERSWRSTVLAILAKAAYEQDRFDQAQRLAESALELGASDDIATLVEALSVQGKVCVRRGAVDRGEALLRQALRLIDETDMLWLRGRTRMDLAEFNRLAGRPAAAIQSAREALALFERKRADALSVRTRAFLSELGVPD